MELLKIGQRHFLEVQLCLQKLLLLSFQQFPQQGRWQSVEWGRGLSIPGMQLLDTTPFLCDGVEHLSLSKQVCYCDVVLKTHNQTYNEVETETEPVQHLLFISVSS